MKLKYFSWLITTLIGAALGAGLAYFFSGSVNTASLASGALFGGLIGLYIGVSATVPPAESIYGKRCDLDSTGGMG